MLIEANLGDSYALFADCPDEKDDNWEVEVEVLSRAHEPDDPSEKKRIENAGGEVTYSTGIARIGELFCG